MHKILIIEDDAAISNLIKSALTREGYSCEIASDGLIGEQMFDSGSWDLVLLDLMLPGTSGFELIEYIKPSKTPVIVISAMNQTGDKIRGLKMGADDYIGKPFQIGELLARVEALLRRTSHTENVFNYLDIEVNLDSRTVTKAGEQITLTTKEFDLLETFIRNKNIAISRSNLYEMVWNEIQAVKAECEELYKSAIESLKELHDTAEFYSNSSYEDFYEFRIKPLEEYYAKKVELLETVGDTYNTFYATYAMGGNSSGDGALTEEYCQWTEFRYELYCFANPY